MEPLLSRKKQYIENQDCDIHGLIAFTLMFSLICAGSILVQIKTGTFIQDAYAYGLNPLFEPSLGANWQFNKLVRVVDHNFEARYLHGNIQKQKGIVNMHLNIRSLSNKLTEIKHLVKEHNQHVF